MSGDIQCFSGGHIPLALLAILMLALCVFLIPTLIVLTIKVYSYLLPISRVHTQEQRERVAISEVQRSHGILCVLNSCDSTLSSCSTKQHVLVYFVLQKEFTDRHMHTVLPTRVRYFSYPLRQFYAQNIHVINLICHVCACSSHMI